jgi:ribonuclease J
MTLSNTMSDDEFDSESLYFIPLGGAGEIGMNLNLYGYAGRWLMVDLGISFGDHETPGVEILLPDPAFIEERVRDLAGIVVTHAHEDHLGAIPYLWDRLGCPIYCTPFAASVLRAKLIERGLQGKVKIIEVPLSGSFKVGPFNLELITMTHSVPEPNALVIRTPAGTVLHSGDWKLDPEPIIGPTADESALKRLGKEGVMALICDSTNAMVPGVSGSEAAVRDSLTQLFSRYHNRIAVGCFATNVARLHSITKAARANDRDVALVGRSLWRIDKAARENGYLKDLPPFVSDADAGFLPKDKTVLICTGSQGEPRAALPRIAGGDHPEVSLEAGDVVIFSAREIPGNEKAIARVQNGLIRQGVEVVTADDAFVHVSGHPARDELVRLYQWVRPALAVPVHGEQRHLMAHAQLADECQVPQTIIPEDGMVIRLGPGRPEIAGYVHSGRLCVDGKRIVPVDSGAIRSRARMMSSGVAVVTLVLTKKGELLADPQLSVLGLLDGEEMADDLADLSDLVRRSVGNLSAAARQDDQAVREAVRLAVRRSFNSSQGRKPMTEVHLVRV